ncbi:LuxR C-terminal-related transcriptional regulator [Rhodococcus pyridinivorans]|uniref:LuxR C-terminal-related transcriptional regulator n=1 Tax=Rhodococcus pyridinivorans TaxID=103816 RepID=UPI0020790F5B|nr:LuxR C-terminal-related transcriptional regulator [Rhodococcus pyridinivorans]USI88406.1 LuxR C-terminal-related transcriptional regulator [Rhodococcus pyridinivorans]
MLDYNNDVLIIVEGGGGALRDIEEGYVLVVAACVRSVVPVSRSVLDAIPRPRLFTVLEQHASLTVMHAPRGFGKRILVASWLHRGGATDREVIWVDALDEATDTAALWTQSRWHEEIIVRAGDNSRCVVVVAGVPSAQAAAVLEVVAEILERCPGAVAVVTVHGTIVPPTTDTLRGIDCRWVSAQQLCFTAAETTELCRSKHLPFGEDRCAQLHEVLGGVPSLVADAVAMLQIAPVAPVDANRRLVPAVDKVIEDYIETRLRRLDDRARRFVTAVVMTRTFTAAEAARLAGYSACEELLEQLDTAGLVVGDFDGVQRSWSWPAAVRNAVLDRARRERPGHVDPVLVRLADQHLAAGRYADAAAYALDAREWDRAVHIIDEHWSHLVADHFETLVHMLRVVPDEVAAAHPGVAAGKALFVNTLAGHPMLHTAAPSDLDELAEIATGPDAATVLHVGLVQAIALRMAGSLHEASERAEALVSLVEAMLISQPHNVTAQLPTIRLQWAIGMQLAGDLAPATVQFELAYRDALTAGFDFVVLNAAGSLAANWALLGDLARTEHWLTAEARVDTSVGYWDEMIRVGGRVANVLLHLDRLDSDRAQTFVDLLDVPAAGEELWGLVAYAHAQHALVTGNAYTGLTLLHRIIEGHRSLHQPGAASHILLTAAEIDLHLALGNGNLARAIAESDTTGHPLVVVAAARVELLTGHPDTARAVLTRISWPECRWLRAHLEALLIEAAACLHTDPGGARRAWTRAVALAETLDNQRAWTTVPSATRQQLAEMAGTAVPDNIPESMFPDTVAEIVLSPREREVLVQLDRGVERKDLAASLFVSPNTIKTQLRSVLRKLQVKNATEALSRARELRLLDGHHTTEAETSGPAGV